MGMIKKIVCLRPNIHSIDEFYKYFCLNTDKLNVELRWDTKTPEYVFITEHVYKDKKIFKTFERYYKNLEHAIYIFQGGEAVMPDLNIFDYAISLSRDLECSDRVSRIPPNYFYSRYLCGDEFENTLNKIDALERCPKLKFCNFIYSNPNSHPMRDKLFHKICEYKKVDSLGGHLNNTGMMPTRRKQNWAELSIRQKSQYKFTIASENETFEGYTSEKLLTTFEAHSVPIYWGNPSVASEYNEDAFINCNKYKSMDEIIAAIRKIDEDDTLWAEMVSSPWQTETQRKTMEDEYVQYLEFMNNLFGVSNHKRPAGTFTNFYQEWFFRTFKPKRHIIRDSYKTIMRKVNIILKRI